MAEAADNVITSYFKRSITFVEDRQPDTATQEETIGEPEIKKRKLEDKKTEGEALAIDDDDHEDEKMDQEETEPTKEEKVEQQEEKVEQQESIESTQVQNTQNDTKIDKATLIKAALNLEGLSVIKQFTSGNLEEANKKNIAEGLKRLNDEIINTNKRRRTNNGAYEEKEKFTGNSKQKKTYDRLIDLVKAGGPIPAKGTIGNMIYKELKENPSLKRAEEDQAQFRKRWVNMKIDELKNACVVTESWRRVDTTKWIYYNFSQLVIKLGGWDDESAIEGACNAVVECMSIGVPFVRTHTQTKQVMFALAEMGWAEIYEQAWTETKNLRIADEKNEASDEDGDDDDHKDQQAVKKRPAAAAQNQGTTAKDDKTADGQKDDQQGDAPDQEPVEPEKKETAEQKQKKAEQKMIRDGFKIKSRYNLACERANKTLDQIKQEKENNKYGWAKDNDDGDRKIMKYLNKCRSKLGEFETDFMLINDRDFPEFKKKHGLPLILVKMKSLIGKLEKPIDDLELVTQTIVDCTETLAKSKLKRRKSDADDEDDFVLYF